jgi:hypothetical protein
VRWSRILALGLLLPVGALATLAVVTRRDGDSALYPPVEGGRVVEVFVVRNWLHANLAVPVSALRTEGPAARAVAALPRQGEYVLLGWGDARHYRERGKTFLRMLDLWRSFLVPDNASVIHIQPLSARPTPETTGKPVLRLALSPDGFRRLNARLDRSFALERGQLAVAGRGRDPDAMFFRSTERTDLRKVCNHWIADLLDAAGVPTTPVADTVTAGLARDLERRAFAERVEGKPGAAPDLGRETPPAYSGRFTPTNTAAARTGDVHFDGYRMRFEVGPHWTTAPIGLLPAETDQAPGRSWAALLSVETDGLVETRRVTAGGGGPCAAPVRSLGVGFRPNGGKRYDVVVAVFTAETPTGEPCALMRYRQP